jgi:hypothetical protein
MTTTYIQVIFSLPQLQEVPLLSHLHYLNAQRLWKSRTYHHTQMVCDFLLLSPISPSYQSPAVGLLIFTNILPLKVTIPLSNWPYFPLFGHYYLTVCVTPS